MIGRILTVAAVVSAVGLVACRRDPASTTTPTAGLVVNNDDAIVRITAARCDREVACNNIGAGSDKQFSDREACDRQISHNLRADIRAEACPYGISARHLDACLSDAQNQRCGNPLDALEVLGTCRKGRLCLSD